MLSALAHDRRHGLLSRNPNGRGGASDRHGGGASDRHSKGSGDASDGVKAESGRAVSTRGRGSREDCNKSAEKDADEDAAVLQPGPKRRRSGKEARQA